MDDIEFEKVQRDDLEDISLEALLHHLARNAPHYASQLMDEIAADTNMDGHLQVVDDLRDKKGNSVLMDLHVDHGMRVKSSATKAELQRGFERLAEAFGFELKAKETARSASKHKKKKQPKPLVADCRLAPDDCGVEEVLDEPEPSVKGNTVVPSATQEDIEAATQGRPEDPEPKDTTSIEWFDWKGRQNLRKKLEREGPDGTVDAIAAPEVMQVREADPLLDEDEPSELRQTVRRTDRLKMFGDVALSLVPFAVPSQTKQKEKELSRQWTASDGRLFQVDRLASSEFPTLEHVIYFFWLLDQLNLAKKQMEDEVKVGLRKNLSDPPRLQIIPHSVFRDLGYTGKIRSDFYYELDEALARYANLNIRQIHGFYRRRGRDVPDLVAGEGNNLFKYRSWRDTRGKKGKPKSRTAEMREAEEAAKDPTRVAWVLPSKGLWEATLYELVRPIPYRIMLTLTPISQRLLNIGWYLSHKRSGDNRMPLSELQELIPMGPYPDVSQFKRKLARHVTELNNSGMLVEPIKYTKGRGLSNVSIEIIPKTVDELAAMPLPPPKPARGYKRLPKKDAT